MKKIIALALSFVFVVSLSACASNNDNAAAQVMNPVESVTVEPSQTPAETETPTQTQTENEPTATMTESQINDKLNEIDQWLIGDIWNDGFWLIREYAETGKAAGEAVDIEFGLRNFDKNVEKQNEYDVFISGLDDDVYGEIKACWVKANEQIEDMYKTYKDNPLTANDPDYPLDTALFAQYRSAFSDEVYSRK